MSQWQKESKSIHLSQCSKKKDCKSIRSWPSSVEQLCILVCPMLLFNVPHNLVNVSSSGCGARVRNDFRIKTIFGSSLLPVVKRRAHVLFTLFVFACAWWCPTHIALCFCFAVLRLVYHMLPISLYCPFLIAPSVFSNVYLPHLSFQVMQAVRFHLS